MSKLYQVKRGTFFETVHRQNSNISELCKCDCKSEVASLTRPKNLGRKMPQYVMPPFDTAHTTSYSPDVVNGPISEA